MRQAVVPGAEVFGAVTGLCNHGKGTSTVIVNPVIDIDTGAFGAVFDGGSHVIEVNAQGAIRIKNACTILSWTMLFLPGVTDSIVVDIYMIDYPNYENITVADSITGGNPPTITNANKATDGILSGWNTQVAAGDVIVFNVASRGTPVWASLSLDTQRQA